MQSCATVSWYNRVLLPGAVYT